MKRLILVILNICIFGMWLPSSGAQSLPAPNDIPKAPAGGPMPGGKALPEMTAEPAPGAPAISAISDITFPDETLVITGDDLGSATLKIWTEGVVRDIVPLATHENRILATLPKDLPTATALVWPVKNGKAGRPIRINGATAWWTWPRTVLTGLPGRTLRICGKNLKLDGSDPIVRLEMGPYNQPLDILKAEPYQIQAKLPDSIPEGNYTVRVHNGTGGPYGWSKALSFEVRKTRSQADLPVFEVDSFGAKPSDDQDDGPAISQAVRKAETAKGGVIKFSPGEYLVNSPIEVQGDNIHFVGAGRGEYDPETDAISGPYTRIGRMSDAALPDKIIGLHGRGCGVRDLALKNNHGGTGQIVLGISGQDAVVENVLLTMYDKRDWGRDDLGPPPYEPPPPRRGQEDGEVIEEPEPGLAGFWDFEEEKGPAAFDQSGNRNIGYLKASRVRGEFGRALYIGTRGNVDVGSAPRPQPEKSLTLSAWVKPSQPDFTRLQTVLRKNGSYALRFSNDNQLSFILWTDNGTHFIQTTREHWDTENWHHVAGTYDAQTASLYIDGDVVASSTLPNQGIATSEEPLYIGGGLGQFAFDGLIDKARVYTRALSPEEIARQYEGEKTGYQSTEYEMVEGYQPPNTASQYQLITGALRIYTKGSANTLVHNVEAHHVGPGVEISPNIFFENRTNPTNPEPFEASSDNILILDSKFRGYYPGEPNQLMNTGASGRTVGIMVHNGKKVIVENCDFASGDRYRARIMNRTVLSLNTANRYLYFGHNHSMDIGSHPSATGMDSNQGEQYLIHYRYTPGGLFHVTQADEDSLSITTRTLSIHQNDPEYQRNYFRWNPTGSYVPPEVGTNRHWILFVSHGKGVGQYREIAEKTETPDGYEFKLDRPWRVVPDQTSRVHLMPAHRNMVFYKNYVDTGNLVLTHKTHGITFWYWTFDTIVADNTFKNLTAGVIYNSRYDGPTGWNLTRGNKFEHIFGFTGDTSERAAMYVDHFRLHENWARPEDRVWYSAGNICRANDGRDGGVAAFLHTRRFGASQTDIPSGPETDSGIVMSVIENNTFREMEEGIILSAPVNWGLVRNNTIETLDPETPKIVDQSGGTADYFHEENQNQ
ncbi:hypothetical protein HQ520_02085 [bacterium]|nr:hypothetical protein [bacterium]